MNFEEHRIQSSFVEWFRFAYPKHVLLSIPNGAKLAGNEVQRAKAWKRLEREGAIPGAADLFLAVRTPAFGGLWIETKTEKGTQSKAQKEFQRRVTADGYGYVICRSLQQFQNVVTAWINTKI